MDEKSAELTKYAANSFLATKISFMNEIANICELLEADVDNVRIGIGSDTRIGKRFLFPGIGYGGSCFPKDVQALIRSSKQVGYDFKILNSVEEVNTRQKTIIVPKIKNYFGGNLTDKRIAIWGLAFKPDTDDVREAPSRYIIDELIEAGAKISAFDPEAMKNVQAIYSDKIDFGSNEYDILENVDALLIATEWGVFRNPDFTRISELMREKVIFDGRNLYDIEKMTSLGYRYYSIGRKVI
jgi:UDPglucose 6-dehydrogenase